MCHVTTSSRHARESARVPDVAITLLALRTLFGEELGSELLEKPLSREIGRAGWRRSSARPNQWLGRPRRRTHRQQLQHGGASVASLLENLIEDTKSCRCIFKEILSRWRIQRRTRDTPAAHFRRRYLLTPSPRTQEPASVSANILGPISLSTSRPCAMSASVGVSSVIGLYRWMDGWMDGLEKGCWGDVCIFSFSVTVSSVS